MPILLERTGMTLLYVTDLHLSEHPPPGRSTVPFHDVGIGKLKELLSSRPFDGVILGGDVFHSARPALSSVLALHRFMNRQKDSMGHPLYWIVVPGNHDLPYNTIEHLDDSPLSLLSGYNVVVADGHYLSPGWRVLCVPYGCPIQWGNSDREEVDIVVLHDGYGDRADPLLGVKEWGVLRTAYPNAKLFLTGHIHQQVVAHHGHASLVNPGPLVRRTVDELKRISRPAGVVIEIGHKPTWEMIYLDDPPNDLVERVDRPKIDLLEMISNIPFDVSPLDGSQIDDVLDRISRYYSLDQGDAILALLMEILRGTQS